MVELIKHILKIRPFETAQLWLENYPDFGYKQGEMFAIDYFTENATSDVSVVKINEAIEFHWNELGLI